jgi:hypothetical protein
MKLEFSLQSFENYSNIHFHENPSSWSRVVPFAQTDGRKDRRTDKYEAIVAFRNFADPRNKDNFTGPTLKYDTAEERKYDKQLKTEHTCMSCDGRN